MSLKRLAAFVLPIGKTGLPRFFLRKNLAMTLLGFLFFRKPQSYHLAFDTRIFNFYKFLYIMYVPNFQAALKQ